MLSTAATDDPLLVAELTLELCGFQLLAAAPTAPNEGEDRRR
jgi:hypothetical protein